MTDIQANIEAVKSRIRDAAIACSRNPEDIQLLAVSKTFPAADVRQAYATGQQAFGENYVDEALGKVQDLADLDIDWHFIGPIQSNKTRKIAENFNWVHGVSSEKIARRLSDQRPVHLPALNVCIQVNISEEPTKSGVMPEEVLPLAILINTLPQLRLRGIMGIPEMTADETIQRQRFHSLRKIYENVQAGVPELDTLSMGMTTDMESAIAEGSTMVRIGTAIFGQRQKPNKVS